MTTELENYQASVMKAFLNKEGKHSRASHRRRRKSWLCLNT
jgi:hypothetical protein